MPGWGDWSGGTTTTTPTHHSNSGWWPDILSNNPISEAVGRVDNVVAHAFEPGGNQRLIPDFVTANPVGHEIDYAVTGPHQLVDFATHDWIASLYALARLGVHQATRGTWQDRLKESIALPVMGPLFAPLTHESGQHLLHDKGSLLGGAVVPMGEGYKQKYLSRDVLHNVGQDPFGTIMDALVLGKLAGVSHLSRLEHLDAAGKLSDDSIWQRALGKNQRFPDRVRPRFDLQGNEYRNATGVPITKRHRAATSWGRVLQSIADDLRTRLPEHSWLSSQRLASSESLRRVLQAFHTDTITNRAASVLISKLPEGLRYAIQHVAELPRDLETSTRDPIGLALSHFAQKLDELRAQPVNEPIDQLRRETLEHRVAVLEKVHKYAHIIYGGEGLSAKEQALHDQFKEAYSAAHRAVRAIEREQQRLGHTTGAAHQARSVLVHRLLNPFRRPKYSDVGNQVDELGTFHNDTGFPAPAITTEEALARQDVALGKVAPEEGSPAMRQAANQIRQMQNRLDVNQAEQEIARRGMEETFAANEQGAARHAANRIDQLEAEAHDLRGEIEHMTRDHEAERLIREASPVDAADQITPGPLAQYGESFAWPHEGFAVVGAPESMLRSLMYRLRHDQGPRSQALADYANSLDVGDAWMEGLINSHPEALTTDIFFRWARVRQRRYVDQFLYRMSGRLERKQGYRDGKLSTEHYVLSPPQYARDPIYSERRVFASLPDLVQAAPRLRRRVRDGIPESDVSYLQRLSDAGVRRVKSRYVKKWERENKTDRSTFQRIVHGGINQVWRYLLLGIKPAWAVANALTNQALVFLKNAGRGGMRAFLAMAHDAGKRKLLKLKAYTTRLSVSKQARFEVNRMIDEQLGRSIHDTANLEAPPLHAATFARDRLFNPPRAGRPVPPDYVSPDDLLAHVLEGKGFGYAGRRTLHMLGAPARAVERLNRSSEEFTRDQALLAKLHQMTGRMARSGDELKRILKEEGFKSDPEKMVELLNGANGPLDSLGDYSRMSAAEREYVTAIMPFYGWYKTILAITAKFFARDPERVWILHNIATAVGTVAAQDMQLGVPVPTFAQDLIPLAPPDGNYQLAIGTRTWNPFQTPVDLARNVEAFATANPEKATPNEIGLGLFGPAIQAGYTAATGQDPFYGGAYRGWGSGQGRPGAVVGSFLYGLPQKRLFDQSTGGYKSKVFEAPNQRDQAIVGWLQYLGIPVRFANLSNMRTRAVEEGRAPAPPPPSTSAGWGDWGGGG